MTTDTLLTEADNAMISTINYESIKRYWDRDKVIRTAFIAGKSAGIREAREIVAGHIEEQSK